MPIKGCEQKFLLWAKDLSFFQFIFYWECSSEQNIIATEYKHTNGISFSNTSFTLITFLGDSSHIRGFRVLSNLKQYKLVYENNVIKSTAIDPNININLKTINLKAKKCN